MVRTAVILPDEKTVNWDAINYGGWGTSKKKKNFFLSASHWNDQFCCSTIKSLGFEVTFVLPIDHKSLE